MNERVYLIVLIFFISLEKYLASVAETPRGYGVFRNIRFSDSGVSVISSFIDVSLYECNKECENRQRCIAIDYGYLEKYCRLHAGMRKRLGSPGYIIVIHLDDEESCGDLICSPEDTCDRSTNSCIINECGHPATRANVTGNRFGVGSKLIQNCSGNNAIVKCSDQGKWQIFDPLFSYRGITCADIKLEHENGTSGVYRNRLGLDINCDFDTDGGDWMVFQRRMDNSVDFNRTWEEYRDGFGNVCGEFWLGLENIRRILAIEDRNFELRIDLVTKDGDSIFALYDDFKIDTETEGYRLYVGKYSGTAGDSLKIDKVPNIGQQFSTRDKDNDKSPGNCASGWNGGWWYSSCTRTNLNGWFSSMLWYQSEKNRYAFVKEVSMKLRELRQFYT